MIYKLIPSCKDYIWGGKKLKENFSKKSDLDVVAETWELSCHKDGHCFIEGTDMTLADLIEKNPSFTGTACEKFDEFPLLIKMIDAAKDLSIQVHPNDAYSKINEGQLGKTEMWYIVDCEEGASIYFGFKEETSKEDFEKSIQDNTLCDLLNKVPVKKGDCFFIEAGTIHAIGAGIVIAEIQQSSNVTYRVYDYGRLGVDGKPRELHVEKACDVTKCEPPKTDYNFHGHLGQCEYFTVDKVDVSGEYNFFVDESSFYSLLLTSGTADIICGGEIISAKAGENVFISANSGTCVVKGECEVLATYLEETKRYRLGIDLGGTNIKAGIVDENNNILSTASLKTLTQRPWIEIIKDMAKASEIAAEKAGIKLTDCISCGIGSPGTINPKNGEVIFSNNFYWKNIPLGETLSELLHLPVKVSNDANCAALGEFVAGAAKGLDSAVMLTLGTGVGGGIIIDGKIFEGGLGGAELGHTVLVYDGEMCTCGRKGCLEAYCSATALIRDGIKMAEKYPDSMMNTLCEGDLNNMNGIIPFKAARNNDEAGLIVVNQYIEWLAAGILNMVNIFRPDIVLLSGGVCGEGEYLTNPINAYIQKYSFASSLIPVPTVAKATLGNDAGILGAANL